MSRQDQFINWIVEFFKRFFTATPAFFKVLMFLGALATLIGYAPDILAALDFSVPATWQPWAERILKIAGITVIVISKLTTQNQVVRENGHIVKKTNPKALPFTAKNEQRKVNKF